MPSAILGLTPEMWIVLAVMAGAIALFVTERMPVDGVALAVLVTLVLTRLLPIERALSGFGNPAVITIAAMFVLSAGLYRTGIANLLGRQVLKVSGAGDASLIAVIMVTVAVLSGIMNDIGVAALMLPVVMDIARRTGRPPSKLLIPLSFASLLGGKLTLLGTAPNIILSTSLASAGYEPYRMFDFLPIGTLIMVAGVAYMVLFGRHLLPTHESRTPGDPQADLAERYGLRDRLHVLRVPEGSPLAGHTLRQSRLGAALDLNVIAIMRDGRTVSAPVPETRLRGEDRLLVEGPRERFTALVGEEPLVMEERRVSPADLASDTVGLTEATIAEGSAMEGRTLSSLAFRERFEAVVLAIRHHREEELTHLEHVQLRGGDTLLLQAERSALRRLEKNPDLASVREIEPELAAERYHLARLLRALRVPEGSALIGRTLLETRLGDAYRVGVLGLVRDGQAHHLLGPETVLQAGDILLVKARLRDLAIGRAHAELEPEAGPAPHLDEIGTGGVGLMEVVLSPRSSLAGRSLREIRFRDRFGVSVLALTRAGDVYDANRRDMEVRLGDALLLFGSSGRLRELAKADEFLALTDAVSEAPRTQKAPVAGLILAGVVLAAMTGAVPIAGAALTGALLMVLARCITPREAYRAVEWPAIVLVAGMVPLGLAMQDTGLATLAAESVVGAVGDMGPTVFMAAFFVLTVAAVQVMPTAAVAVLMAPIAISTAVGLDYDPRSVLMLIAMAVSTSFMTPVGHAVNVLVMGPGGYRFTDYTRVGLPLTGVVFVAVMLGMRVLWPLQ